jgi:hypothetical protein
MDPDLCNRILAYSPDARHETTDQKAGASELLRTDRGVERVVEPMTRKSHGFRCSGGTLVRHQCR